MPNDQNEIIKIVNFLKDVKEIFSAMVSKKDDLFLPELHDPLVKSWLIIEVKLNDFIGHLENPKEMKFFLESLKYVGLRGDELNFKLAGFNSAYKLWNKFKDTPKTWKELPWKKLLKNLLEWINVILSSLNFILNIFLVNQPVFLIADPIREFKDAMEAGINSKEIKEEISNS